MLRAADTIDEIAKRDPHKLYRPESPAGTLVFVLEIDSTEQHITAPGDFTAGNLGPVVGIADKDHFVVGNGLILGLRGHTSQEVARFQPLKLFPELLKNDADMLGGKLFSCEGIFEPLAAKKTEIGQSGNKPLQRKRSAVW